MNGRRERRTFGSLDAAKEEARMAALNIQRGLSSENDLRPQDRENLRAVQDLLSPLGLPLVAVVEEYLQCRRRLGAVPLLLAVEDFVTRSRSYEPGILVPRVVDELIQHKQQDRINAHYLKLLDGNLRQFAKSFPGEITQVTGAMIEGWLRRGGHSMVTRNNWLKRVKELFAFAKRRGYLPKNEATVAEALKRGKQADTDVGIFTPEQMAQLMSAATAELIPVLAIGGFAGLRGAEIARLNWSAVDLGRKIIELRAGQAKTASRRIVPISDNLAGWLAKIDMHGPVVPDAGVFLQARRLAKSLGLPWPHNALRHSYISYRIAVVQSAAQVALEAGNSPTIIFKHYRELVTKDEADKWFGILPETPR
ncbi:MAG: tyrosine-type recombinase/integrase [Prosthecobacter sp.]|uniref:tyrosine-type recombinase/integrase n=1 Tax=Prosthecobacter sp. TaxID=1965333 RepID=UPI0038FDB7DF